MERAEFDLAKIFSKMKELLLASEKISREKKTLVWPQKNKCQELNLASEIFAKMPKDCFCQKMFPKEKKNVSLALKNNFLRDKGLVKLKVPQLEKRICRMKNYLWRNKG